MRIGTVRSRLRRSSGKTNSRKQSVKLNCGASACIGVSMFVYSRIKCSFAVVGLLDCSIRSRSSVAEMKGNSAATTRATPKICSQVVFCFDRKVASKAQKPSISHSRLRAVSKRT